MGGQMFNMNSHEVVDSTYQISTRGGWDSYGRVTFHAAHVYGPGITHHYKMVAPLIYLLVEAMYCPVRRSVLLPCTHVISIFSDVFASSICPAVPAL